MKIRKEKKLGFSSSVENETRENIEASELEFAYAEECLICRDANKKQPRQIRERNKRTRKKLCLLFLFEMSREVTKSHAQTRALGGRKSMHAFE